MADLIETAAGPLHWKDYGGSGDTIVLIHGLGGSIANWETVAPAMAERARVVALDLPGFGLSPPAADWSLETHARAVRAFAAEFGTATTLLGNSLGGLLAEMVAARHPDTVDNLLLVSPATPPLIRDRQRHWPTAMRLLIQATPKLGLRASKAMLNRYDSRELVKASLASIAWKPSRIPIDVIESFVELTERRRQMPWAPEAVPGTATSIAKVFKRRREFVSMIRRIEAPTHVVHGLEDRIVSPAAVEWLCSLRSDWELIHLEDTGHTPQLDAPVRLLAGIVPWLDTHLMSEITV